jgi:hypothetical protein
MKSLLVALSLALLLGGCESMMRADVTQFSTLTALPAGRSFVVVAEPQQSGALEFQHYAGLVGGALQEHGLVAGKDPATADLVVVIYYGSLGPHTEVRSEPGPWGWGWGWRHGYGPWGGEIDSTTYYAQMLEVQIFDGPAWRNAVRTMVYQGRATGGTTANDIGAAMPALVRALFEHFPGNHGGVERVTVPLSALPSSGRAG